MESGNHIMVAAIDFGTTFSTWGYSFNHDFDLEPTKVTVKHWTGLQKAISLKGPTSILIEPDGRTFHSFGFDAETTYAEFAEEGNHTEWYLFKKFKMQLYDKLGLTKDFTIYDATGKPLQAKTVFSLSIRYLKDDLLNMSKKRLAENHLIDRDIHWVLTVPAIWNDVAKQFMREAAEDAGLKTENVTIALEPECASIYCRQIKATKTQNSLEELPGGSQYIILDAGGGTVDITAHQIMLKGNLKEIHQATGGDWGGIKVDQAFENFLREILGHDVFGAFKEKEMETYLDLMVCFELKKREVSSTGNRKITIQIPASLSDLVNEFTGMKLKDIIQMSKYRGNVELHAGKIKINHDIMEEFFEESVKCIIKHLEDLFRTPQLEECQTILMVGGYSESSILQERISSHFKEKNVIIPEDAGLAVLKGAVIFGHNPSLIAERICRYTYGTDYTHIKLQSCSHRKTRTIFTEGTERCADIFDRHVCAGDAVKVDEWQKEKSYYPLYPNQTSMTFNIYCTKERSPELVTDNGCVKVGTLALPMPNTTGELERESFASFLFGGTEIQVKVHGKSSGTEKKISLSI